MGESEPDRNIYQACNTCGGTGRVMGIDSHGLFVTVPCGCKVLRVIETGLTIGQVERLVLAERDRLGDPAAKKE